MEGRPPLRLHAFAARAARGVFDRACFGVLRQMQEPHQAPNRDSNSRRRAEGFTGFTRMAPLDESTRGRGRQFFCVEAKDDGRGEGISEGHGLVTTTASQSAVGSSPESTTSTTSKPTRSTAVGRSHRGPTQSTFAIVRTPSFH